MKQLKCFLLYIGVFGFATSCIDDGAEPLIDFTEPIPATWKTYVKADTLEVVQAQPKAVFIEDFTGYNCTNCPKAAEKIDEIEAKFKNRVVSMGVHSSTVGSFVNPNAKGAKHDFRSEDGDRIAAMLATSGSLPEGVFGRWKFLNRGGEITFHQQDRNAWLGFAETVLEKPTPISIDINILEYDEDTLICEAVVIYHEDAQSLGQQYLAIYLSEDGLIDFQADERIDGGIKDYEHNHVFRKSITDVAGDSLVGNYERGRIFRRRVGIKIEKDKAGARFKTGWKTEKLNVVAMVMLHNEDDFEVVHVVEKHVGK